MQKQSGATRMGPEVPPPQDPLANPPVPIRWRSHDPPWTVASCRRRGMGLGQSKPADSKSEGAQTKYEANIQVRSIRDPYGRTRRAGFRFGG